MHSRVLFRTTCSSHVVSVLYDVIRYGVCHNELYFCMADLQKKLQNIHLCSADIFILLLYIIYLFE